MGSVVQTFDPATLLEREYLLPRDRLPARSALRQPEAYWSQEAKRLLDRKPRAGSAAAAAARRLREPSTSFEQKCRSFFQHARAELERLATAGVSPNVIAAALVRYAWNWHIDERNPVHALLARSERQWAKRLKPMEQAVATIGEFQRIARLVDQQGGIGNAPLAHDALANADFEAVRTESYPDEPPAYEVELYERVEKQLDAIRWPREIAMQAQLQHLASELRLMHGRMEHAARTLRRTGRPPEDKLNCLVAFLAALLRARGVYAPYRRLANVLDAAASVSDSPRYFRNDPQKLRQRANDVEKKLPQLVRTIERAVHDAYRAADRRARR